MKTFLIFGKSSSKELKEISLKYRAEVVSLVGNFEGDVKSMYVMLKEKYLVLIFAFPEIKRAMKASIALSKLTDISFRILPAVPVDEINKKNGVRFGQSFYWEERSGLRILFTESEEKKSPD